mmetsp:Transcript_618/g.1809  ORF Transcript_618/g.1809 Transcript_618/m.1809 type:complete len:81 (-) Transcript_618:806-1048(-)
MVPGLFRQLGLRSNLSQLLSQRRVPADSLPVQVPQQPIILPINVLLMLTQPGRLITVTRGAAGTQSQFLGALSLALQVPV